MRSGTEGPEAGGRMVAATVIEEMPAATYRLRLSGGEKVLAHAAGALERNFVRLLPGDQVEVELSPHDLTRGRIRRKL